MCPAFTGGLATFTVCLTPIGIVEPMRQLMLTTAIAAMLALSACGSENDPARSETAPSSAKPAVIEALPESSDTILTPGRYQAKVFQPGLALTIPDDSTWKLLGPGQSKRHFGLTILDSREGLNTLGFHRMDVVVDPRRGARTRADGVAAPKDFVGWLAKHPHLDAGAPRDIEIGGVSGRAIDVTVTSAPKRVPDECSEGGSDCLALFFDQEEPIVYNIGAKMRFISLEVADTSVVVEIFSVPGDEFDRVEALLDPVLRSVRFEGATT